MEVGQKPKYDSLFNHFGVYLVPVGTNSTSFFANTVTKVWRFGVADLLYKTVDNIKGKEFLYLSATAENGKDAGVLNAVFESFRFVK